MSGISSRTIAKLGKNEDISTTTLRRMVEVLHCSLSDIVEFRESNTQKNKEGIRLATVFSGIGAIEHALDRIQISHSLVFACDNGDIDILSKKVGNEVSEIAYEIIELQKLIDSITISSKNDKQQKDKLKEELSHNEKKFTDACGYLNIPNTGDICNRLHSVINAIIKMTGVKKIRIKEYDLFLKSIFSSEGNSQKLRILKVALNVINDFAKDNPIDSLSAENLFPIKNFKSSDGIIWE